MAETSENKSKIVPKNTPKAVNEPEKREGSESKIEKKQTPADLQKAKKENAKKALVEAKKSKQHNSDIASARVALMELNDLPWEEIKSEEKELQEQSDETDKKIQAAEESYRSELQETYQIEKSEIEKMEPWKEKEEKMYWLQKSYIESYVHDFDLSWENKLTDDGIKKMAQTLPDAWQSVLVNWSANLSPSLQKFRNDIIRQLPTPDTEMNSETFSQFRDIFEKKTGLSLTEDQIRQLIMEAKKMREVPDKADNETATEKENREKIERDQSSPLQAPWLSGQAYEDYLSQNPAVLWEPNVSGVETSGYSFETGKEATENAKNAAKTIKEAARKKYGGSDQQPWEFEKYIDRHAQNNPNFSADKPFLLQSLGQQKAYIYYPGGEIVECSATHGVGGVNNRSGEKWSSLWSKELIPDSNWSRNGNKILYRTAVKGLEWCNANDLDRLIRIHEQHGAATHGCTGLPLGEMKRFDAAIDAAWGGAQEIFV